MLASKQRILRRKALALLPRLNLENLISTTLRPWHMSRPDLTDLIINKWDDGIKDEVVKYIETNL